MRGSQITGASIPPGAFHWTPEQLFTDVTVEYKLNENFSLFANARDLTSVPDRQNAYSESTPAYARQNIYTEGGALWNVGINATF